MPEAQSSQDRAIKKSAENEPEYVGKPSAQRLPDGELRDKIMNSLPWEKIRADYHHVNVIDYPSYDERFTWYRVNLYYSNPEDPRTTLDSWIVDVKDLPNDQ